MIKENAFVSGMLVQYVKTVLILEYQICIPELSDDGKTGEDQSVGSKYDAGYDADEFYSAAGTGSRIGYQGCVDRYN